MFDLFLTPEYTPFAVAFAVMIGVGLIEAIGLGLGQLHGGGDLGAPDGHGVSALLDGLGLGGLPVLIWLTSLLGCFTLAGVAIQRIATASSGVPLAGTIAAGGALVVGIAANTVVARGLARIWNIEWRGAQPTLVKRRPPTAKGRARVPADGEASVGSSPIVLD